MANVVQHITRRAKERASSQKGFTLVEMLAALAVLVMLTGMIVMGTRAATSAYGAEQFASQADVLAGEIENALSAKYRYTTSATPELLVENGRFVLKGTEGGKTELLNSGAYGNCQVSFTGETSSLKPVKQSDGAYVVEGSYIISKKAGGNASREYSFYFKSYGDTPNERAYGGIGASDDSGGSGGSGDSARDEAWSELNELIKTAEKIEQGKKYADAFNQLQGAINTAKGWRDNSETTVQQLKDAKKALQDAISAFNSSPERPDGSGDAATLDSVSVTITPDQQSYEIGQTGVRVIAEAIYSDGNDYEYESLAWESSNPGVVTVSTNEDGEGVLTFVGAGSATITATIDGVSGSIGVAVESQGGESFVITIGGQTYSAPIVEYDNSGILHAGIVYSSNGSYYYASKDVNDPHNRDLETRSTWGAAAGGVSFITENFVDASAFTQSGGTQCSSVIYRGTLYYDSAHHKLYACYQDQAWLSRPDVSENGWNDVSGLISG